MFDHFSLLETLKQKGVPFAIATVVRAESPTSAKAGDKAIVTAEGVVEGWVGGSCAEPTVLEEAKAALEDGECRLIHISPSEELPSDRSGLRFFPMHCYSGGTLEIYIEPHPVAPRLLIFGNSPVAAALASLGDVMKYRVAIVDLTHRPPMAGEHRVIRDLAELPSIGAGPTYAVVATHGTFDEEALTHAVKMKPEYLGLVASRRRAAEVKKTLSSLGVDQGAIDALHAPAGADIHALSAEEIALSIMAQIVDVRRSAAHASIPAEAKAMCCSNAHEAEADATKIEAILLAAGESTRMGQNKLLMPIEGTPLVRRSLENLLAAGFAKVVVVLGFEAERVRAALEGLDVQFVVNDRFHDGQPTSVRAGLTAISAEAEGVMICLADQPDLTADDLLEIRGAFVSRPSGSVLVPMFKGQRGNPIVLDRHGLETILARGGNFACRQFTTHHADLVVLHEMKSDHVVRDLDLPEDYARRTGLSA